MDTDGRATSNRVRTFAYADPPYIGQSRKVYGKHPDFAGEVDHAELIDRLERDFPDGWALSLSVPSLPTILSLCPPPGPDMRICAWVRGQIPKPPARLMWSWEPVLIRTPHWRRQPDSHFVRDANFIHEPSGFQNPEITGQKPVAFCHWLFDMLGLEPDDEFVDVFPGSGSVGRAWERWRRQLRLLA